MRVQGGLSITGERDTRRIPLTKPILSGTSSPISMKIEPQHVTKPTWERSFLTCFQGLVSTCMTFYMNVVYTWISLNVAHSTKKKILITSDSDASCWEDMLGEWKILKGGKWLGYADSLHRFSRYSACWGQVLLFLVHQCY
ncbi:uncharacterized protein LOC126794878 [Argentina anserina]|uniref:uncharacterized protein LOC126794878 n=1 Tax=Argentina anserina TaxID=57926 RepID=UPI0021765F96|nr:uncharacterized protein LOC126794878 [Potentilla anserina]